jgi:hypothetical protein
MARTKGKEHGKSIKERRYTYENDENTKRGKG